MNALNGRLFFLILSVVTVSSEGNPETDQVQELPRYVVFPGLDAEIEEVEEWNVGFASPFNVFFGPKPYILGWLGEDGFAPEPDDEEYPGGGEYPEVDEGELEGEEEVEGEEPIDYDYEQA